MPQADSSDERPTSANPDHNQPSEPSWANTDIWMRVLTTLVYGVIFWLSLWLLGLAVVINLVMLVATGKPNPSVVGFARQLAGYQRQIIAYATLDSDQAPFPFGEPLATGASTHDNIPEPVPEKPEPAANRKPTPPRKKTAKKKAGPATRKKKTRTRVQSDSKNGATADTNLGSENAASNQSEPQDGGSNT